MDKTITIYIYSRFFNLRLFVPIRTYYIYIIIFT